MDTSIKVLIVDDFATMRRILKNILKQLGFKNLVEADDGTTAWDVLESQEIDLIISDWNMPKMTGVELTEKILAIRPDLPIIMATGYSSAVSKETYSHHGICEFMTKPHSLQKLSDTIHKVLS